MRRIATYATRGQDLHETPEVATLALAGAEARQMPKHLWEPACGKGAIVEVLRSCGHVVAATDKVVYPEYPRIIRADFLKFTKMPFTVTKRGIVTNPPYRLTDAFVRQALGFSDYVAMLLPLTFLAGIERRKWLEFSPLARVHVFSARLPMMHRDGYEGKKARNQQTFAWFVWDRRWQGEPVIRWL
jgi:hypothetical protein